jgi:hypothetical protein
MTEYGDNKPKMFSLHIRVAVVVVVVVHVAGVRLCL